MKVARIISLLLAVCVMLWPLTGCERITHSQKTTQSNPANAILLTETTTKIKTGQFFYLSLNETQSVPMRWKPIISDESRVRVLSTEVDSSQLSPSAPPGSPGEKRIFYFEALSPGECWIYLYDVPINADYNLDKMTPSYSYNFVIED